MKRLNIQIIGREKGEESQLKDLENTFNKITEASFPNLKNVVSIKVQARYRTPNWTRKEIHHDT